MNIFSILLPKHTITYLNATDPLDEAVQFMMASSYTAVPVIDNMGKYIGIVSEGDFLKVVMECGREGLKKMTVGDITRLDKNDYVLNTVETDEIMERILDRNFLSVIDDRECFIGIITRKSIIMELK